MAGESRTRTTSNRPAAAAHRYDADEDTEITLGTGKMLVLFFGLVVLCGLFFGTGYMIGHNSARIDAHKDDAAAASPVASLSNKPSATDGGDSQATASDAGTSANPSNSASTAAPPLVMDSTNGVPMPTAPVSSPSKFETKPKNQQAAPFVPVPATTAATQHSLAGGSWVQVAAVSHEEDAQALVSALTRKQYAASVNTAPTDKLFHVVIGPFTAASEAEATKKRLGDDGYNAIVKH